MRRCNEIRDKNFLMIFILSYLLWSTLLYIAYFSPILLFYRAVLLLVYSYGKKRNVQLQLKEASKIYC